MKKKIRLLSLTLAVTMLFGSIAYAASPEPEPPLSVRPASTRALGNNGWYTSDIIYDVTANDSLSGIKSVTYSTDGPAGNTTAGSVKLNNGKGTITLSINGEYNMTVVAADYAGNSRSQTVAVKLDKELPVISDVQIEDAGALTRAIGGDHNQKVKFTVTASDQVSGLARIGYKLDGDSDYTWLVSGENTFVIDRVYQGNVCIVAEDIAGNLSDVYTVEDLTIEDEAPVVSLEFAEQPNKDLWHKTNVVVNIAVTDNGAVASGIKTVEYTTDETVPQSGTVSLTDGKGAITLVNNGTYHLTVSATDNAENTGSDSIEVNLDQEIPVISHVELSDVGALARSIGGVHNQQVQVTVTATDAISGVEQIGYKIGSGEYTYLAPGVHSFVLDQEMSDDVTIVAVDYADNVSEQYVIESLIIEDTPPTLDITYDVEPNEDGWHNEDIVIHIQANDDGTVASGIASVVYATDESENPQSGTVVLDENGAGTITITNEGVYTLTITVTDASGNITEKTLDIKMDKTPPELQITASVESNGIQASANTDQILVAVDTTEDEQNPDIAEIALKLQIDKVDAAELGEDAASIQKTLESNEFVPAYLDINLYKTLTKHDASTEIESVDKLDHPIDISLELEDVRTDGAYSVIRVHEGKVETLPASLSEKTLTFSTDRFSSYAVVFKKTQSSGGSGGMGSSSSASGWKPELKSPAGQIVTRDFQMKPEWTSVGVIPYCTVDGKTIIAPISVPFGTTVKYIAPVTAEYKFKDNSKNFYDVENHWAVEDIHFVAARELFGGIAPLTFAPDAAMTRAMFVTVLARIDSADVSGCVNNTMTDVANDSWYEEYVNWAIAKGVAHGVGNQRFEPERVITREEMAVMLDNYIKYKGFELETVSKNTTLTDRNQVSPWANAAVTRMLEADVLHGRDDNRFDPKAVASRAEVAAMFHNFIKAILK